jgi:amidase
VKNRGDLVGENVVSNVLDAQKYSLVETAAADAAHTMLYRNFQQLFDTVDLLICPATTVSPFPVDHNYPAEINGQTLDRYYAWYAITWALSLVDCDDSLWG